MCVLSLKDIPLDVFMELFATFKVHVVARLRK